ncbi:MAG TPA: hypothetical protein VD689_01510 [Nitrosopumilaceae archaeon]|nr:hypothetical protein [Nitrosopumilaceae archaeon]
MTDYIIKDIEELIKSNRGDSQRLSRIKDDFEKTKIITLPDRKYVESLASRYIKEVPKEKKRDFMKSFQELSFKKPRMPEPTKESLNPQTQVTTTKAEQIKLAEVISDSKKQSLQKIQQPSLFSKQRKWKPAGRIPSKKTLFIAVPVVIAIIAIGVAATQFDFDDFSSTVSITPKATGLSITTDQRSYNKGDIISISGTSETSAGEEIKLSIQNPNGQLVWSENIKIKSNGKFSTLLIAAGAGWNDDGKYTLKAEHGSLTNQLTIDFET